MFWFWFNAKKTKTKHQPHVSHRSVSGSYLGLSLIGTTEVGPATARIRKTNGGRRIYSETGSGEC